MPQFCARRFEEPKLWNYLLGDVHFGRSIATERLERLHELERMNGHELTIALHEFTEDRFTTWHPLGGHTDKNREWFYWDTQALLTAPDLHRAIIENEIVVESDYATYEENAEACRFAGKIFEGKGFQPHYYYSGSRSVHMHLYIDWACLLTLDNNLQEKVVARFVTRAMFVKKFMDWLRTLFTTCYGTNARQFDRGLAKGKHLIRCELSRNKRGHKTFLGYTYKDIPPFPIIANEDTGILPELGELRLSSPPCIQELIEEFLQADDLAHQKAITARKERALSYYLNPDQDNQLKGCAAFVLSDEFAQAKDGFKRAAYLLTNELRRVHGPKAEEMILDWNARMGAKCRDQDLQWRCAQEKVYHVSHEALHELLTIAGFPDPEAICKSQKTK